MEIKDLKIGDRVQVAIGTQRLRDTDDKKYVLEHVFESGTVFSIDECSKNAKIKFDDGSFTNVDDISEWYKVPNNTKIVTHEDVKRPSDYGSPDIDLIDYWCKQYTSEELRGAFKSRMSECVECLGYKDDEVKELNKIIDYATRYIKHLEKVKA